jgi:hypothetical protein
VERYGSVRTSLGVRKIAPTGCWRRSSCRVRGFTCVLILPPLGARGA